MPSRPDRQLHDALDRDVDAEVTAVAFSPEGLKVWQSWNATNQEIADWSNAGFSGTAAALWLCHDETITPASARAIGSGAPPLRWHQWAASGIPPEEIGGWMQTLDQREVTDPQVAVLWRDAGYSPSAAASLMDLYPTPADLAFWQSAAGAGQNAEQVLVDRFVAAGVDPVCEDWSEDLTPCRLPEAEMEDWIHTWGMRLDGFTDPADIRRWRDVAFSLATDEGIPLFASTAAAAARLGASPEWACEAARRLESQDRHAGLVQNKTIARLYEIDPVDPERAAAALILEWRSKVPDRKKHLMDRTEWTEWLEAGLTAPEAQQWRTAGVDSPQSAAFWRDHNPEQIAAWHNQTLPHGPRPNAYTWGYALADMVRRRDGQPEQAGQLLEQVALSGLTRG